MVPYFVILYIILRRQDFFISSTNSYKLVYFVKKINFYGWEIDTLRWQTDGVRLFVTCTQILCANQGSGQLPDVINALRPNHWLFYANRQSIGDILQPTVHARQPSVISFLVVFL